MILWIIAAICAFFIKGLCGFANTLVFTSILKYSLQGTTQGNGLTGGVPPVRFSM